MFRPNQPIVLEISAGTDVYGQPKAPTLVQERCAVVSLTARSEKTSVRADSSATRGNANELEADGVILLSPKTAAVIDAVATVAGQRVRIAALTRQFDLAGRPDHLEASVIHWSA
jgi:hypothetical protein